MRKLLLLSFWIQSSILFCVFLFILLKTKNIDYNEDFPKEKDCKINIGINLTNKIKFIKLNELDRKFPYDEFLKNGNYYSVNQLIGEIEEMNLVQDTIINQIIISQAITERLYLKWSLKNKYNLDEIFLKLMWIEKFNQYKELNTEYKTFFTVVYKYWMDKISNDLSKLYHTNNNIKFESKFSHLVSVCESKRFHVNIGNSKVEKFILNLKETNFIYILNRLLLDLKPIIILISIFIFIFTIYGQFLAFKKIFIYFQKKYKS